MTPFDEANEKKVFWKRSSYERYFPEFKGFLSDFVYWTRGLEAPSVFSLWGALFSISSAVKREAWLDWGPLGSLYPNMYTFFIAPPGIGKTTIIDLVDKLLRVFPDMIEDENIQKIKELKVLRNKSTTEAILQYMIPDSRGGRYIRFVDEQNKPIMYNGKPVKYRKGSDVTILLSELSTLFSKRSYAEDVIEALLDLYDPKDVFEWRTIKRGIVRLVNLHTNLLGATTPSALVDHLPKLVVGDGFLSRTFVIYATESPNKYPIPKTTQYGPTAVDMAERLAYIAENCTGKYQLSQEAHEYYDDWYIDTYKPMMEKQEDSRNIRNREGINVLKLALLMRMSRYKPGNIVELKDIRAAIKLLNVVYSRAANLILQATSDDFMRAVLRIEGMLEKVKRITRRDLVRSAHLPAQLITQIIMQLVEEDKVTIYDASGRKSAYVTGTIKEVYEYGKT